MADSGRIDIPEAERMFEPRPRDIDAYVQQDKIRTIHFGIGAIGAEIVRSVLNSPDIEIVGAVDANPAKAGHDLGEAAGLGRRLGIPVSYNAEALLRDVYADVVIHTTGSSLTEVFPQIASILATEKSVVSSCEELAFPWARYPEISQQLDRRAREAGVRVLGTGVNPGFVMDLLPLMAATVSRQIKSIRAERVVDVSTRRMQLQRKVGVGLSVKAFQMAADGGGIGHVGLRESVHMVADTVGWQLDDVKETLEPMPARNRQNTEFFSVDRGYVIGLKQTAIGVTSGRSVVRLDLEMSVGAQNPHDLVEIDGTPPVRLNIPGGIAGDLATASIMANCVPAMARSRQVGLLTMRDLPVVPYFRPRPQRSLEFE
jgi:4-hydroxy-tetrahydrodipicolinate reductase